MKTIAAVQTEIGGPLRIEEVELDDPAPDQVTVKLYSSGICHSQLHQMHNPSLGRPLLLGHEGTGVVSRIGSAVTHVKPGDLCIVTWVPRTPVRGPLPRTPTGAMFQGAVTHGHVFTWARDVQTNKDLVVPIPDDHPRDLSCIVGCAVLTGAGAVIHTAKVRPGESVAVFGVGGVGLSAIRAASILEAYPIIAVDLDERKLAFAKSFGATHTVNASGNVDPVEAIRDLTGGGVDYAFDAIGKQRTSEQILQATRAGGVGADNFGGMAVLVGIPQEKITIDPVLFTHGQRQYRGSLGASFPDRDFAMYLRWHQEGKFPLDRLITRRYALEQIGEACGHLHAGEIMGRAILEF
ncbi:MAG TPA: zinc-binding dehydrogenase [Hyphomicrobiaceae bacterium]|nr:zinc-binding dehydrogenase [Hyphomicrobiaceae bacterium]